MAAWSFALDPYYNENLTKYFDDPVLDKMADIIVRGCALFFLQRPFNPYWQILENSSRIFSEISVFQGVSRTDFWTIHPSIFCQYLFSFWTISVCVPPQNSLNTIFRLNALFWMSFPDIGLCHAPKL